MICVPTQQLCFILHGLYPRDHLLVILLVHICSIDLHNSEDTDVILTTSSAVSSSWQVLNMSPVWKGNYDDKCKWQGPVSCVRGPMFLTISQDSTFHGNGVQMVRSWGPTSDRVTFSGFFGKQLGFKLKYLAPHQHNKGLKCLITS